MHFTRSHDHSQSDGRILVPSQVMMSSKYSMQDDEGRIASVVKAPKAITLSILTAETSDANVAKEDTLERGSSGASVLKRSRRRQRRKGKNGKKSQESQKKGLITDITDTLTAKTSKNSDWFNNSTRNKNAKLQSTNPTPSTHSDPTTANSYEIESTTLANSKTPWLTAGNLPDVFWRAVSMDHLRSHPRFHPLPEPQTVHTLRTLEDVQLFRQDSWQWDALHVGRCTTSQAVAALGFLDPEAATILSVPRSWRRGSKGAFLRLRQKPLRTLEEMQRVLCNHNPSDATDASTTKPKTQSQTLWSLNDKSNNNTGNSDDSSNFVATYHYQPSQQEINRRRKDAQKFARNDEIGLQLRMIWGSTQEATALLTALNYFSRHDDRFYMKECGMCGAGLALNQSDIKPSQGDFNNYEKNFKYDNKDNNEIEHLPSTLLVGATPDGLLCHSDGRLEVLEVKNHCPFYMNLSSKTSKSMKKNSKRYSIGDKGFDTTAKTASVFAHYIPQLMMEMYCLGPECKSAVMVRQTATAGALILRLYRDDEWIAEMIHFLKAFQREYVDRNIFPPSNVFYNNPRNIAEQARYRRFVNRTLEIRNNHIEVVAQIPPDEIQRISGNAPLFLD